MDRAEVSAYQPSTGLRRTVLMVSVLDSLDFDLTDHGVLLTEWDLSLGWDELAWALGSAPPETDAARSRLVTWITMRCSLHAMTEPARYARPVALPRDHVLHPGPQWVRHQVLGGALDVGVGVLGLLNDLDQVVVPPAGLLTAAGLDDQAWWPKAARYLADKGQVAGTRLDSAGPLRPIGDCDVVTLLASSAFRKALCGNDPFVLRTAAVPMRRRGWLDLSRVDPAFAVAAAAATDPTDRGFDRPVLITCEEVSLALAGGEPMRHSLADPATANAWDRS